MNYINALVYLEDPINFNFDRIRGLRNVTYMIHPDILVMEDFQFLYSAYLAPTAKTIQIGNLTVYEKNSIED